MIKFWDEIADTDGIEGRQKVSIKASGMVRSLLVCEASDSCYEA